MPPEAIRAVYEPKPIDFIVADCWSVGAIIYQMLTLVRPISISTRDPSTPKFAYFLIQD